MRHSNLLPYQSQSVGMAHAYVVGLFSCYIFLPYTLGYFSVGGKTSKESITNSSIYQTVLRRQPNKDQHLAVISNCPRVNINNKHRYQYGSCDFREAFNTTKFLLFLKMLCCFSVRNKSKQKHCTHHVQFQDKFQKTTAGFVSQPPKFAKVV